MGNSAGKQYAQEQYNAEKCRVENNKFNAKRLQTEIDKLDALQIRMNCCRNQLDVIFDGMAWKGENKNRLESFNNLTMAAMKAVNKNGGIIDSAQDKLIDARAHFENLASNNLLDYWLNEIDRYVDKLIN